MKARLHGRRLSEIAAEVPDANSAIGGLRVLEKLERRVRASVVNDEEFHFPWPFLQCGLSLLQRVPRYSPPRYKTEP